MNQLSTNQNEKSETPSTTLSHLDDAHKYFFAGFLNTAMDNLDMAIEDVAKRTGVNESIKGLFNNNAFLKDKELRRNMLCEYIPILKTIGQSKDGIEWQEFVEKSTELYNLLKSLRNYYTHFYHADIEVSDNIFVFLDKILLDTTITVKKERMKLAENKDWLIKKYPAEFEEAIKELSEKKVAAVNKVFNQAFWGLLMKEDGNTSLHDKAKSKTEDGKLSANGFLLFVSFFLDRKSMEALFARTKYFKDNRGLKQQATHWIFSYWTFRDVRRHIKSDYDNHALLLQMVDELTKCPDEIYQYLTTKQKEEFVFDVNEYYKDNEENQESLEDSHVVHPVIRKRYEDKFTYFALRFLDEFGGFNNLKFQVELGKYVHNIKPKTIKGTQLITNRRIVEKIRVFGKLSAIAKHKNEYFAKFTPDEIGAGWEVYPSPYYVIENNNIPIYLKDFNAGKKEGVIRKENKPDKATLVSKILGADTSADQPHAFLSAAELPALLYALLIEKKCGKEIEENIKNKMYEQAKAIRNAVNNNQTQKNIPKKLHYVKPEDANCEFDLAKLKRHIQHEIQQIENRLVELQKISQEALEKNKPLRFGSKFTGEVCNWLADDIKRFADKEERERWKGYHQAELQAILAFIRVKKDDLKALLTQELGMNLDKNPVLKAALQKDNLKDFYQTYLYDRKKVLNDTIEELNPYIKINISFTEKKLKKYFRGFKRNKYKYVTDKNVYKTELLKHPMNLPRGLFDESPTYVWHNADQTAERARWHVYAAKQVDNMQQFYGYKREYPNDDKIITINPSNGGIKAQIKIKIKPTVEKNIYRNETAIRKLMRQDVYQLAMISSMFKNLLNVDVASSVTLKQVYLDREQAMQKQRLANSQSNREAGDKSENIVNDKYILSNLVDASIFEGRVYDKLKIKDVGKFKRLELDKRVITLITYDDKKWHRNEVLEMIEAYNKLRRDEIFKLVHSTEQKILEAVGFTTGQNHPTELEQKGAPNFKKYLAAYLSKLGIEEKEINLFRNWKMESDALPDVNEPKVQAASLLCIIRNKLAHEQLPVKANYQSICKYVQVEEGSGSIEKILLNCAKKAREKLFES